MPSARSAVSVSASYDDEASNALYHRLCLARALAERMRDSYHSDTEQNKRIYDDFTVWENICSALSAYYNEDDVIYSGHSSLYASYLAAGGVSFRSRHPHETQAIHHYALPSGAASFYAYDDAEDTSAYHDISTRITAQQSGMAFYTADVSPDNADAVAAMLEQTMYARKPLIAVVRMITPSRDVERTLSRAVSRHAGALLDSESYTDPSVLLTTMRRLNLYVRAENMQALVVLRPQRRAQTLHDKRQEDILGYLTRTLPDNTRRHIVYRVHEYMQGMYSRIGTA